MTFSDRAPGAAAGPQRVRVTRFRAELPSFLRQVRDGKSFLLTSRDEVVAEIKPPNAALLSPREPGAMRGQIWTAPDWKEWPPGFLDTMEGGEDDTLA